MNHLKRYHPVKWLIALGVAAMCEIGSSWAISGASPATEIIMEDGSPYYLPVRATVASGIPIRWDNRTPTHHTVTHNDCLEGGQPCVFDSGPVPPGAQFTVPGLPPGQYGYHCRIHPIMRGLLTVTDAPATPSQL